MEVDVWTSDVFFSATLSVIYNLYENFALV
jgi:hypothetical protein